MHLVLWLIKQVNVDGFYIYCFLKRRGGVTMSSSKSKVLNLECMVIVTHAIA